MAARPILKFLGQCAVVLAVSSTLGVTINGLRDDRLPWIMPFPTEFQCPSLVQSGEPISIATALDAFGRTDIVWVDARKPRYYEQGHIQAALSVPYSFIEPISEEAAARLRPFTTIIVYCNTREAERSRLMAGELSAQGLEGVTFLDGGFLAWVKSGGAFEGKAPNDFEELLE